MVNIDVVMKGMYYFMFGSCYWYYAYVLLPLRFHSPSNNMCDRILNFTYCIIDWLDSTQITVQYSTVEFYSPINMYDALSTLRQSTCYVWDVLYCIGMLLRTVVSPHIERQCNSTPMCVDLRRSTVFSPKDTTIGIGVLRYAIFLLHIPTMSGTDRKFM